MPGRDLAKPWPQRQLKTLYLRVPEVDWSAVTLGHKTEFRSSGQVVTQVHRTVYTPTPVLAYSVFGPPNRRRHRGPELMVLEDTWREPLLAISPESLDRECFTTIEEFRRYWIDRTHKLFKPDHMVQVYRVRPWGPFDDDHLAGLLLRRLFLDPLEDARS